MLHGEIPAEAQPRGKVLILGPTDEYVTHIRAALSRLIDLPDRYSVRSIPALLNELANVPPSAAPTHSMTYNDVNPDLARLVDEAFLRAKSEADGDFRPTRETVYRVLIDFLREPPPPALDAEWVTYLRDPELPRSFAELSRLRPRRYRGLMAYIGIRVDRWSQKIGHIIVDEAQDIHPIEWEILGRLGNTGGWTVLGDLNQRRTDHTYNSWDDVARALALEDENDCAPVTVLERGYRSTSQIIRFANQLLPSEGRRLFSLQQDGEDPQFRKVPSKSGLILAAVEEAEALSGRVGRGTTAVIGMDTEAIRRSLVNRGWKADPTEVSTWVRDGRGVRLLPPERARGLEFDGVVVVEPAEFPENVGRQGVLYTALTRANRHLTVVYNRALPGRMRARPSGT
jgi:DNA helicase-2/ATP-dependent DNA helicase PcrA